MRSAAVQVSPTNEPLGKFDVALRQQQSTSANLRFVSFNQKTVTLSIIYSLHIKIYCIPFFSVLFCSILFYFVLFYFISLYILHMQKQKSLHCVSRHNRKKCKLKDLCSCFFFLNFFLLVYFLLVAVTNYAKKKAKTICTN